MNLSVQGVASHFFDIGRLAKVVKLSGAGNPLQVAPFQSRPQLALESGLQPLVVDSIVTFSHNLMEAD